jgi:phosphoserine phosphatase
VTDIQLITFSGEDQGGLTAGITAILAGHGVNVLDIGQAVIHATLSMGVLVEIPADCDREALSAALQSYASERSMRVRIGDVSPESYRQWVDGQGRARYIITLLARKITADQLARVTEVVSRYDLNIDGINRLSGRIPLGELPALSKACVEFTVRGELPDSSAFREDLLEVAGALDVDLAFQQDNMYRRNRRLVAFDMDSTLIEAEVIDELAAAAGVGEQVSAITERAMRGELAGGVRSGTGGLAPENHRGSRAPDRHFTYPGIQNGHSFRRVYLFRPAPAGQTGYRLHLCQRTGYRRWQGDWQGRRRHRGWRDEGVDLQQVIAVGDGANDLPMLSIAGLGIAFRAKPLVQQSAEQSISTLGLDAILYLLGFSDKHQGPA